MNVNIQLFLVVSFTHKYSTISYTVTATVHWYDQSKSGSDSFREKAPYVPGYVLECPGTAEFYVDPSNFISGTIRIMSYKQDRLGNRIEVPITADVYAEGHGLGELTPNIMYMGGSIGEYYFNLVFGSPGEVNPNNYNNYGSITIHQTPLKGDSVRDTKLTPIYFTIRSQK